MAYEAKTKPSAADVRAFIDGAQPDVRRADGHRLCDLMQVISGVEPKMWGPSIVGFDALRYRYESGHSGETCRIGFSPRKNALVLYLYGSTDRDKWLARLGKHSAGKGCLYIKSLADVDIDVLADLIRSAWRDTKDVHGERAGA